MSARTIQIEIDAETETCGDCTHADRDSNGTPRCYALAKRLRENRDNLFLRLDACKAREVRPTSEANARADERRKVLEAALEVWRTRGGMAMAKHVDEQLAALAKRGEGGT